MDDARPVHDTEHPAPAAGWSGRWYVVLPAAAFVAGLLLGGGLVWVGGEDAGPAAAPSPAASPGTGSSSGATDTTVVVPAECVAAADTVAETVDLVERSVTAVRDLQAGEIVELLDQLEDLDARARTQADACRRLDVDGGSPAPSTSPTADTTN